MKSDENPRNEERERERETKRESGCRGQERKRVQSLSVSMTTMWGSVLFVCSRKQTSDCRK